MADDDRGTTARVLYAEDNPFDEDLTRAHFDGAAPDLQLDVVHTGEDCLARLQSQQYDVLLLDNHLPDMDGLDVLKHLAARRIGVPVVVTTSVGDEALAVQVLQLGAFDYVPKDGNYVARLPAVLKNVIAEHREGKEPEYAADRPHRRILYAERHQSDIDLTLSLLAEVAPHLRVEVVSSAADVLTRLSEAEFDLVLIDLRLPEMNALELLKEVKARGLLVPFIVVTGGGDEAAAVASLKLGAYDYIVKRDDYLTRLPHAIEHAVARCQFAQINRRLQKELAERQRAEAALREHAAALADVARQKDEFLAMLSHEMRNPLAPIRTALELLGRAGLKDGTSADAYDVIDRQITHLSRLLDDLLDVARITTGRVNLRMETIDVLRVVEDAIDSTRDLILARRHRFDTSLPEAPLTIRGDPTRLAQVLVNLLNNAAKYTAEAGTIRLRVTSEDGHAVVRVTDTGAGIPPRLLPKIFDLFTQDDRTLDRAEGGLGLGLTLVRRITELHGGSVAVHSEGRGRGSEFTIRLPLHAGDVMSTRAVRVPSQPSHPLRYLVVEDNVDAARMLELALTIEGNDVRLAVDGSDAIASAAAFRPDVIVLDIGLPRMNGYDAARAIRQLPGLADVHIIAVTGYGQNADYEKSREAGVDIHLVKPVDLDELLRIVAVGRARSGAR
jgi:signal transduction histidine kinase